jgi:hypothetical protein
VELKFISKLYYLLFFRHITPEKIYIEPLGADGLLIIDRVTQEIYISHGAITSCIIF